MKLRLALAAATCLALPILAQAQPVTGPYISLGGGTTILNPPGLSEGAGSPSLKLQFRDDYSGAVGVGYGFGDGFRVELGGDYFRNTVHKGDSQEVSGRLFGAQRTYGAMVNVLYDVAVGLPIFPYFGAGAGYQYAKLYPRLSDGFTGVGGTKGSFAYDIIGGVAYPLTMVPGLSLTAEYRFMQLTESRKYALSGDVSGTADIGQESTHTFLVGLRYQIFNPPPPAPAPAPAPAPVEAPAPTPAKTYLVFFDWDKATLTTRALDIISQAASDSKTTQTTTINVSGYTDTSGTPKYNQGLSERRASAVAAQLVADGVAASEIETHAFGETHLLVPTGPGVREPQNRRVEIVLN